MSRLSREDCVALDASDPLAALREQFVLPSGVIYLDGNSLGALPRSTPTRLAAVVNNEWGGDLITSWNKHGWIDLPRLLGDKLARLIGAGAGEVVVADSTSINLFKVLAAALRLNPQRRVILSEEENFPTDLYIAQGLVGLLGDGYEVRPAPGEKILDALDDDTAVLMLTHVNYRTGAMHDLARITAATQAGGALMLWDLSHSAGVVPLDLTAAGADFAVGCGYKYLNGGPGAPAFVWVAPRHQEHFIQPLSGWLGHAAPFAFESGYRPAHGIDRYICGTPPVLSMAALDCGLDVALAADSRLVREKSIKLTGTFIRAVEQECDGFGLTLLSPREAARRGSQVSFAHRHGYPVMQALIARGVIGDFRAPDILRFGFAPLYVRFADAWDAAKAVRDVLETRAWDRPEFHHRAAVT